MKPVRFLVALLLCFALVLSFGAAAYADPGPFSLRVLIGDRSATVRAFQNDYSNNLYLSLSDLSAVLNGTARSFRFRYNKTNADGEYFTVDIGQSAADSSGANARPTETPWVSSLSTTRNRIFVDGLEHRYYTYRAGTDLYMSLTDVQLMLDLPAERQDDGLRFYPGQHFSADVPLLDEAGYFDVFSAVLVGDADTGEILYSRAAKEPVAIASISKLMSYLLLSEAAEEGQLRFTDSVQISQKADALSRTVDGMVTLTAGSSVPFRELLEAMLLASSNESALALAEYCAGSEEAIVARMNTRAEELGLESARFYTPHGLPVYLSQAITAKVQNRMSAEDLFKLCSVLLEKYPEITKITSQRYGEMPTLHYVTANSNAVVFNLEGCSGLKTGSTNKAGSCLVASLPITVTGETHNLVAIVLGAESADVRNQATEILLRYAREFYLEEGFAQ